MLAIDETHDVSSLTPPFEGTPVRDVLNSKYWAGVRAARRLTADAFSNDADPAAEILNTIAPVLPVIGESWNDSLSGSDAHVPLLRAIHGSTDVRSGIHRAKCGLEYSAMRVIVHGPNDALNWTPLRSEADTPPEKIGIRTTGVTVVHPRRGQVGELTTYVYVVFLAETLNRERIVSGCDRALEYLGRNLNALRAECDAWRETTTPRIRDEVNERRAALNA